MTRLSRCFFNSSIIYISKITKLLSKHSIENTPEHMFVHNGFDEREYKACEKVFIPTIEDISTKRPSTFFKQCKRCRDRFTAYRKNKILRDAQKYIDPLE